MFFSVSLGVFLVGGPLRGLGVCPLMSVGLGARVRGRAGASGSMSMGMDALLPRDDPAPFCFVWLVLRPYTCWLQKCIELGFLWSRSSCDFWFSSYCVSGFVSEPAS